MVRVSEKVRSFLRRDRRRQHHFKIAEDTQCGRIMLRVRLTKKEVMPDEVSKYNGVVSILKRSRCQDHVHFRRDKVEKQLTWAHH